MACQLDFHTGLDDKGLYACRLLRKALRTGGRIVVTGDAQALARLDQQLWTFEPGEFIPHARLRAGQALPARLARTPIWLADDPADAGACDVLVNLGPAPLALPELPERVIELVTTEPADAQAGRQRWRAYLAAGLQPVNRTQGGA